MGMCTCLWCQEHGVGSTSQSLFYLQLVLGAGSRSDNLITVASDYGVTHIKDEVVNGRPSHPEGEEKG